jgi:hypothetical protein
VSRVQSSGFAVPVREKKTKEVKNPKQSQHAAVTTTEDWHMGRDAIYYCFTFRKFMKMMIQVAIFHELIYQNPLLVHHTVAYQRNQIRMLHFA